MAHALGSLELHDAAEEDFDEDEEDEEWELAVSKPPLKVLPEADGAHR